MELNSTNIIYAILSVSYKLCGTERKKGLEKERDNCNKRFAHSCTNKFGNNPYLLIDFEAGEDGDDSSGGGNSWREELQRRYQQENDFLAELRARNANIPQTPSATLSSEQEQERGEREEADGEKEDENESNWAEAVKRWVNR